MPTLALRLPASIAFGAGDNRKLYPAAAGPSFEHGADMFAEKSGMVGFGQICDVRKQQCRREIEAQFGDIRGCMEDKSALVDPQNDIAGSLFKKAVQNSTLDVTQTNFHTDSAPAV